MVAAWSSPSLSHVGSVSSATMVLRPTVKIPTTNTRAQAGISQMKKVGHFLAIPTFMGYAGGQAEYVRVLYADISPRIIPEKMTDEQVLFLTDIFPTRWSAIDWAQLKGGQVVAVFGSGPGDLMAQKAAWINSAGPVIAINPLDYRLQKAKDVNYVDTLYPHKVDVIEAIREMTGGHGAVVCVDAVGFEPERTMMDKVKATINFEKGSMKVLDMAFNIIN